MDLRTARKPLALLRRVGALALALSAGAAGATDYTVNSTGDSVAADGVITLREALQAANTNMAVGDAPAGEPDGDTIRFDAVVFATGGPILLGGTELGISDDVVIDGMVTPVVRVTIDPQGASRHFLIDTAAAPGNSGEVRIVNLVLQNGNSGMASGGAMTIAAGSSVVLEGVDFLANTSLYSAADGGGGAIYNAGTLSITGGEFNANAAPTGSGSGGAIFVEENATLIATGASFGGNSAARAGGAIESRAGSTTTLTDVTMTENSAGPMPGNGGGLHITGNGNATISGGTYAGNSAASEGGALWNGSGTMTISGATISDNTASGDDATNGGGGVFNNGGTVSIENGTQITGNIADGAAGSGGGIFGEDGGTITIADSTISNNRANRAGGGIEVRGAHSLTITGSTLSGNNAGVDPAVAAPGNGGALHVSGTGTVDITNTIVENNVAASEGGGLWNQAGTTMTVDGSTIRNNTASGADATNGGGGVFNNGGVLVIRNGTQITGNIADGAAGSGGGIFGEDGGSITIADSTISNNRANRAGGGIEVRGAHTLTITGSTLAGNNTGVDPAVAAPGNGGALHVSGTGTVEIIDSIVENNVAANEGGGLWNQAGTTMTVRTSTIRNNEARGATAHDGGGGLFNNRGDLVLVATNVDGNSATGSSGSGGGLLNVGGTVSITGGRLTGNSAVRAGGAIEDRSQDEMGGALPTMMTIRQVAVDGNSTGDNPGNGGGLHITGADSNVTVAASTFSNNSAAAQGGGLWNFGGATLNVVNSTVSGNSAVLGGGVYNKPMALTTLINTTVASNSASDAGGGVYAENGGPVTLRNTIVADNSATNANNDVEGVFDASFSLIEDAGDATINGGNNVVGQDPALGMLAFNGGPTQTHALTAGSPAIGAADSAVCTGADVGNRDQRGVTRTSGSDPSCDIGSFERVDGPVVTTQVNAASTPVTVMPGDSNVVALAFGIVNSADESVTFSDFSGTLSGTADFASEIAAARLYLDANGNGVIEASDVDLTASGQASVQINAGNASFTVSFSPARQIASGGSEHYILAIDVASDATVTLAVLGTGGAGLLLGFCAAPARRRWLAAAALAGAVLVLSGCDNDRRRPAPQDTTVRFAATAVTLTGDLSNQPAQGVALPITGPEIRIDRTP